VTYLGTATVKSLALALETFSQTVCPGLSQNELDAFAAFSLRVAQIARLLAGNDKRKGDEAFVAGLLHAVGRLLPTSREALREIEEPGWPLLGAYLLGLWGIPHPIIEAIAHHQKPHLVPHDNFELVDVLHVAHHLARATDGAPHELDRDHLRSVGFDDDKLDKAMAQTQAYFHGSLMPNSPLNQNAA
jgi:HD-like signal output (HDOD) protein